MDFMVIVSARNLHGMFGDFPASTFHDTGGYIPIIIPNVLIINIDD